MQTEFITVVSRSHLDRARTLAASLYRHETGARLRCYLAERDIHDNDDPDGLLELVPLAALELPRAQQFCFRYDVKELATAIRPFALLHTLRTTSCEQVVYLDSDTDVLQPLARRCAQYLATHAVALTPHLLAGCLPTGPREREILRAGVYNSGFIALRRNQAAGAFLQWWAARLEYWSIEDPLGGVVHDQRWLDLAVGLFPQITIIRDPGINVAYWNMHERELSHGPSGWQIQLKGSNSASPLALLHFSGLTAERLSSYLASGDEQREAYQRYAGLAADYRQRLAAQSAKEQVEYSFQRFDDGQIIDNAMREVMRLGIVNSEQPFAEREKIQAAIPANVDDLFWPRATYIFSWACTWRPIVSKLIKQGIITVTSK